LPSGEKATVLTMLECALVAIAATIDSLVAAKSLPCRTLVEVFPPVYS
jgi:hypothetical protein